ncbi:tRNA lysidine(34) synthetase TilS, partial [bacterium]|nr:tRNA lysidine(34) synthetase TilS [bacterium]
KGFAGQRHLIAVSGGLDSMVLLHLAIGALPPEQWVVAHYDHAVRPQSSQDALFVRKSAAAFGLDFETERGPGTARDEASLRDQRLRFLEACRARHGCESILTAHNLDDQWETFLMRLIRGTGLEGLAGIAPTRGAWVRPLLDISRERLAAFAEEQGVRFRLDESNFDTAYFRNRIRADLLPHFQKIASQYGGYEKFLERFAELRQELDQNENANAAHTRSLGAHLLTQCRFWLRLDRARLLDLPTFWALRVLRLAIQNLGVPSLDRDTTHRLLTLLHSKTSQACFPGFRVIQSCGWVYFQTREQSKLSFTRPALRQGPDSIEVPDLGLRIRAHRGDWEGAQARFFEPGDRLGGRKLSDYFLEKRVPLPERRLLPVLVRDTEVLWVFPQPWPGLEIEACEFPFAASLISLENPLGP